MAESERISYAEFGRRMIAHAVTAETLRENLARVVPDEQELQAGGGPADVRIRARTEIGEVRELAVGGEELRFAVPLAVHLSLDVSLLVGQEQYAAVARTSLQMEVQTQAPLTIYIFCAPVSAEQVTVESEGQGNWFDVVKRLGLLDGAIQQQVATIMNSQIAASAAERSIDLRRLMELMMADPELIERAAGAA